MTKRERLFWSHVNKRGPIVPGMKTRCWIWMLSKDEWGYGNFWFDGRMGRAHRYAYIIRYGSIPKDLCILHRCNNPACVRHLYKGTQLDNVRYREYCGRTATGDKVRHSGESSSLAKLRECDVKQIIALYKTSRYTQLELGRKFGVARQTVNGIVRGNNWRHIFSGFGRDFRQMNGYKGRERKQAFELALAV